MVGADGQHGAREVPPLAQVRHELAQDVPPQVRLARAPERVVGALHVPRVEHPGDVAPEHWCLVGGLHYQLVQPQGKLVWVTRGAVFDVAVDIRRGSPHFGRWFGCVLDDIEHRQLYVPPGFAHGFCVLSDEADFFYKCSDYYHPQSERGIAWDDPDVGIDWPLREVTLSAKDQANPRLAAQSVENLPIYEG